MDWGGVVKNLVKDAPEVAGVLHLGKAVQPEIEASIRQQLPKATALRMESNGAFSNGSLLKNNLEQKFGKDEAKRMLQEAGVTDIQSAASPGRNLMAGAIAAPASQFGNPWQAAKDLGQEIKPVVDAYEGAKSAAASALTGQMNFGKDPEFQKAGTAIFSNTLDPMNAIPGGAGVAAQAVTALPNFAHGGEVNNMANLKVARRTKTHTILSHPDGHEIHLVNKHLPAKYAEGGEVEPQEEQESFLHKLGRNAAATGAQLMLGPIAGIAADTAMSPDDQGKGPLSNPVVPQAPRMPGAAPAMPNLEQNGMAQQLQGIQQQANATGAEGAQELEAAKGQEQKLMDMDKQYQSNLQSLDGERQAIMQDIGQGHIDPSHYMNSMSAGSKVGTAIGLILGGMGQSGHNPAMDYLNKQIDNDIMAQKSDLGRKENLLSANLRQFGNLHDAMAMTKATYHDIYAAKIMQAAASSKSPIAQAQAQQAIGQLKAQSAPLMMQAAQRQTAIQGLQAGALDPSQAVPLLVPKEHQKAVFDEIAKAQDATAMEGKILDAFERANKQNTVAKTGFGLLREPAPIMEIQAMAMPLIHDAAGRVNEAELEMVKKLAPAPGDSEDKVAQKRQGLVNFINFKKSAPTAKGFGIDLSAIPSTSRSAGKFKPSR